MDKVVKYLLCFFVGFLLARMIGDGFSVGVEDISAKPIPNVVYISGAWNREINASYVLRLPGVYENSNDNRYILRRENDGRTDNVWQLFKKGATWPKNGRQAIQSSNSPCNSSNIADCSWDNCTIPDVCWSELDESRYPYGFNPNDNFKITITPPCDKTLEQFCEADRKISSDKCVNCAGMYQQEMKRAGCTETIINQWCTSK